MRKKRPRDEKPPLHERVAAVVRAAGVSNTELATRTGWSYLRVLRVLNGDTDLTGEDIELLAELLKRPVGDLYEGIAA